MLDPFPDDVEVQYGLVNFRAIWGLPVGLWAVLLVLGIIPLIWSARKWWITVLCGAVALGLGVIFHEDPQCGAAWYGEYELKDYYD